MKKVIFGGTFDPIHNGHIHIAYEALYNLEMDEIIFMPAGEPPHKSNRVITSGKMRYEMVKRAIDGEEKFSVSNYEINNKGLSYTYNTLIHFNNKEPNTEWFFLVGVDSLMSLKKWKNIEVILDNCTLIVFSRSGFSEKSVCDMKSSIEREYNAKIIFLKMSLLDISSTSIKEKVAQHKVINYLLPHQVEKMIKKYNLYRDKV